jgi:hypothetical protein
MIAKFTSIAIHELGTRGELAPGNEKEQRCWLCGEKIVLGTHIERSNAAIDQQIDAGDDGYEIPSSFDVCNMCAARIFVCR